MPTLTLPRALHTITVNAAKVGVILPDTYEANGSQIGTDTGVEKASATNKPEMVYKSSELLRAGQAIRVRVRWSDAASKIRTANILCDVEKAATVCGDLVGKGFRGGTIKTAYFPRRARFE